MIGVSDIITSIRFKLGDMQGATRSSFEIIEAINQALAFIYAAFGERHISVGLKTIFIEIDDNEPWVILPSDFHNVNKVISDTGKKWKIDGNRFIGKPGVYKLSYYHLPQRVTDASNILNIPNSVRLGLEGTAVAFLNGNPAEAEAITKRLCDVHVARGIDGYDNVGPVQVWGDRV